MERITYTNKYYEPITRKEMDEGMNYLIKTPDPVPSLKGVRLALPLGPCAEEPEVVVPLDFITASGGQVDIIAPDWTPDKPDKPDKWLPVTRFWTPTLKIPYQKKISAAVVSDYRGVILVGGTWNPAVVRNNVDMLKFIKEAAIKGLPIFSICHGAQILISAGLVTKGLKVTGSEDIRIDLRNAGADVVEDKAVVVGEGSIYHGIVMEGMVAKFKVVSSRDPNDLPSFCRAIADNL